MDRHRVRAYSSVHRAASTRVARNKNTPLGWKHSRDWGRRESFLAERRWVRRNDQGSAFSHQARRDELSRLLFAVPCPPSALYYTMSFKFFSALTFTFTLAGLAGMFC